MKIRVEQQDIENGKPNTDDRCAVALAVRRQVGGNARVFVGGCCGEEGIDVGDQWAPTPPEVQEWIERFDDGLSVEPVEFELALED